MEKINGIYLDKKEFGLISKCVMYLNSKFHKKLSKKSITRSDFLHAADIFLNQLREKFNISVEKEELKVKNNGKSNVECIAYRFQKERPLLFILYEKNEKVFSIIDEARFDAFDTGPFERPLI